MITKPSNPNFLDGDNDPDTNDDNDPPREQAAAAKTNDNGITNDNRRQNVSAAMGSTALVSLEALGAVLNNVDTSAVSGRSGPPMMQFKRDNGGTWMFGQAKTVPEEGATWAINPTTFRRGWICFGDGNKVVGEKLLPVNQPAPDQADLPDTGYEWKAQWAVNMRCANGTDAGIEVVYKPTTVGGIQAIGGVIDTIRDRLNGGMHNGLIVPVVLLEKSSYDGGPFGRVYIPVLTIVDWMPLSGPAPAPASPPPPASPPAAAEQPRRRRVG